MAHFVVAVFTNSTFEEPNETCLKMAEKCRKDGEEETVKRFEELANDLKHKMQCEIVSRLEKYGENYEPEEGADYDESLIFYDWFNIGGRWSERTDEYHQIKIKDLKSTTDEIIDNFYGFVTLENEYKERPFHFSIHDLTPEENEKRYKKEMETYKNSFKLYLEEHPESSIIVVDFHI